MQYKLLLIKTLLVVMRLDHQMVFEIDLLFTTRLSHTPFTKFKLINYGMGD